MIYIIIYIIGVILTPIIYGATNHRESDELFPIAMISLFWPLVVGLTILCLGCTLPFVGLIEAGRWLSSRRDRAEEKEKNLPEKTADLVFEAYREQPKCSECGAKFK